MEKELKEEYRAGISAQTSVGGVTATIGGHGEEQSSLRVASGHSSRAATPLQRQDGVVLTRTELRRKQRSRYKAALKFLRGIEGRSPETLTAQETMLKKKHEYNVRRFERLANSSSTQVDTQRRKLPPHRRRLQHNSLATEPAVSTKPTKKEGPVGKRKDPFASKRQRSDDSGKASDSKRLRPEGILASLSSKPELQVVIIDRNDPEGKFTVENWLKLEENINQALHDAMCRPVNPFPAEFDGIKWFKGAKAVACANEESLRLLKDTIHNVGDLWPGAKIDVVPTDQVPERTIIKVWIPPPNMEVRTILDMIKRQNKDCVTEDWTIKRGLARDKGNGKELWISIGPESKSHLQARPAEDGNG
ncbi:hypothetical protein ACLKA6_009042 [Drosophila palustris]